MLRLIRSGALLGLQVFLVFHHPRLIMTYISPSEPKIILTETSGVNGRTLLCAPLSTGFSSEMMGCLSPVRLLLA